MSTKNNPGAFRCYEAALPDEHVFTILARDPAGPATLRFWATEREKQGKTENPDDRDRIDDARRDALLMEDWREANLDPLGDGGPPSWKLCKVNDEDGGPIRTAKDPTVYVPAERDGDEAVRINVEWLTARTRDLVEGRMSREEYTQLIELACQSPDRRNPVGSPSAPTAGLSGTEEADDSLIYRLEGAIHSLRDGRLPTPYDLYRAVKKKVLVHVENEPAPSPWNYECIGLGLSDLEAILQRLRADTRPLNVSMTMKVPKDAMSRNFVFDEKAMDSTYISITDEMSVSLAVLVDTYRAGLSSPVAEDPPVAETTSRDVTEIDTPDMPPHRFAMFDKGKGWAYGRGLEISPSHIPAMLDRMEEDGYTLVAALGAQADKVGMIFQRGPRYSGLELAHGFGGPGREELERRREGPQYARFMGGEALDDIRKDDPPVGESENSGACGMGRGQEP